MIKNLVNKYKRKNVNKKISKETNSVIANDVNIENSNISRCTKILSGSSFTNSSLGFSSYISSNCYFDKCIIGKYCSISQNVIVVDHTHPLNDFVSTSPVFYNNYLPFKINDQSLFNDSLSISDKVTCEIGNDVWIGRNVLIKGGIKIGDGAVIGMGAVVLNDVPPYAVVAGIPARIIKYRYEDSIIKSLLDIEWWNWDIQTIKERKKDFLDIKTFVNKYRN